MHDCLCCFSFSSHNNLCMPRQWYSMLNELYYDIHYQNIALRMSMLPDNLMYHGHTASGKFLGDNLHAGKPGLLQAT